MAETTLSGNDLRGAEYDQLAQAMKRAGLSQYYINQAMTDPSKFTYYKRQMQNNGYLSSDGQVSSGPKPTASRGEAPGNTIPVLDQVTNLDLPDKVLKLLNTMKGETQGAISNWLSPVSSSLSTLELPSAMKENLVKLREESVSGLKTGADELIGKVIADLARRGVLSSTTAEGGMGEITKQLAPYLSSIMQDYFRSNVDLPFRRSAGLLDTARTGLAADLGSISDFYNTRLNLPFTQARERVGIGSALDAISQGWGSYAGNALQDRLNTLYGPLASIWGNVANMGNTPMGGTTTTTSPGITPLMPLAYGWAQAGFPGLNLNSGTKVSAPVTSPYTQNAITSGKYNFTGLPSLWG